MRSRSRSRSPGYRRRSRSRSRDRRSPPRGGRGGYGSPPRGGRGGGGRGGGGNDEKISLLVRNISDRVDPEDLREVFTKYGVVKDIYIPLDYYTNCQQDQASQVHPPCKSDVIEQAEDVLCKFCAPARPEHHKSSKRIRTAESEVKWLVETKFQGRD
eukprot:2838097-Rhodomonas_salina.2